MVNAIYQGSIRFSSKAGLNRYYGCRVTIFRNNPFDYMSLANHYVMPISEDRRRLFWVGTGDGVNSLDPTMENFRHRLVCGVLRAYLAHHPEGEKQYLASVTIVERG